MHTPYSFPLSLHSRMINGASEFSFLWGGRDTIENTVVFFSHSFDQSTTQSTQTWGLNTAVHFQEHKITSAGSLRH